MGVTVNLDIGKEGHYYTDVVDIAYDRSNEKYSIKTIEAVSALLGVKFYKGVLGGGNQNLLFIGALQLKNLLRGITLVDINKSQIEKSAPKIASYSYQNSDPYFKELRDHGIKLKPCSINIKYSDIIEEIKHASQKGKYFIYLSNITPISIRVKEGTKERIVQFGSFYGDNDLSTTNMILNEVLLNNNINEGSIVMIASVARGANSSVVLLQKESGMFNIYYTEYNKDCLGLMYPPAPLLRK